MITATSMGRETNPLFSDMKQAHINATETLSPLPPPLLPALCEIKQSSQRLTDSHMQQKTPAYYSSSGGGGGMTSKMAEKGHIYNIPPGATVELSL